MGKNKNKGNKPAAVPPAPEVKAEEKVVEPEIINENGAQKPVEVIDANGLKDALNSPRSGLDMNHRVDILNGLDRHFMQPNAAETLKVSQETVDKVRNFAAHGWVLVAAEEVMYGESMFATTLRAHQLPAFIEAATEMGVNIDQKLLPALPANPQEEVKIPSTAVKPSKQAKEKIKKEHEILQERPETDPSKITTEDELTKAIIYIMAESKNAWEKIKNAIAFYRSYLTVNKKDCASKTDVEILEEIKGVVHDLPLIISGIGQSMGTTTGVTKSPIVAFTMLRNSVKNRKTGEIELNDREIADYVRAIIIWKAERDIEDYKARIAEHEKNLKELSKDKKANAKGIEDVNERIESCKNSITHSEEKISIALNPSSEAADTLLEKYDENDRIARMIFKAVLDSYYGDVDLKTVKMASIKHNVQQMAGVIINLFRDPATPNPEYNEANLVELEEEKAEEPKKE